MNPTYSCGISTAPMLSSGGLGSEVRRICKKLQLSDKDHVLEIAPAGKLRDSCGRCYGVPCDDHDGLQGASTISPWNGSAPPGVEDRFTSSSRTNRDLKGRFDKLVSIEMIEAVGHHYLNLFPCCATCSRSGVHDSPGHHHRGSGFDGTEEVDFINVHFPGSCIPLCHSHLGTPCPQLRI